MSGACLLDANVLIALAVSEHQHHARAATWAGTVAEFAVCPITEGALVRFLLRVGHGVATAQDVVRGTRARRGFEFWPDDRSYADADLGDVVGHRQVTGAYLAGLAKAHGARLATLDAGLVELRPDVAFLLPGA